MTSDHKQVEQALAQTGEPDNQPPAGERLLGTLLDDKYLLQRLLGQGAYGAVYQALHKDTDRILALKLLLPRFASDPKNVKRFQNEAKFLSQLEHPNIARVYGFGVAGDGSIYLTMEYLEGITLSQLLHEERLSTHGILSIFKQIAQAVSHAHASNIVHRDLKPHNVVILPPDASGKRLVKVLDFGIAKLAAADDTERQELTAAGVILGTPTYMSPEQSLNSEPDLRCDVYSFGCMLYEALAGHVPFQRESYPQLLHAHINDAPPPIPTPKSDKARKALSAIALKCLAKQPGDRFQSLDSVIERFSQIESGGDIERDPPVKVPVVARLPPSRRVAVILSLICAGILLVLLVLGLAQRSATTRTVPVVDGPPLHRVRAAVAYREDAADATDPEERKQLLLKSKATLKEVIKNSKNLTQESESRWELCMTLSAPGLPDSEYKEAVQACIDCADAQEKLQKESDKFESYDIRRKETITLHLAFGIQFFWLGDRQGSRAIAARAARLDAIDKVHTVYACWPAEMLARYDKQPGRAARFADQSLVYFRDHGAALDEDIVIHYCEEAVIDYIADGMTAKEAKQHVFSILGPILQTKKFSHVRPQLNKTMPDDSTAKWSPAYNQSSHGFAAKVSDK